MILSRTSTLEDRSSEIQLGSIERMLRRIVASYLDRLEGGCLTIEDPEFTRSYGEIDSSDQVRVTVSDPSFYSSLALRGLVGAAEAYMEGMWETDDLTGLIRIMARNMERAQDMNRGLARLSKPFLRRFALARRNSRSGSKDNIASHYDLGNEFFELFLDPTMTYSCAIFDHDVATLEQAQRSKYDRICRKLDVGPRDHVLEIGSGWGGFAIHAAGVYGARVTTTTISERQYELARERVRTAGLTGLVEVLLCDYRDLSGTYDKLVSIEMVEAVGHEYMNEYFRVCCERLKPDGVCLIQAIINHDQGYERTTESVDFIKRYIFPGGQLPSIWSMCNSARDATDLRMVHMEDISEHYATTLSWWRRLFKSNVAQVRQLGYDERFVRMWEFYLCYCEGGFAERSVRAVQLMFERPLARRSPLLGSLSAPLIEEAA